MSKILDELEKHAKSSYSQSTVGIEIADLLALIEVARAATELVKYHDLTDGKVAIDVLRTHINRLERGE